MKNKVILGVLICLGGMFLVGCGESKHKLSFNDVLESINLNNEKFMIPDINVEDYVNKIKNSSLFSAKDIESISSKANLEGDILSNLEANEDIDFFFELLKKNYGPYIYFGGDDVFLASKEKIIEYIDSKKSLSKEELYNVLIDNLSFIKDNHFIIKFEGKYKRLCKNSYFYMLDNEYYYKDDRGFFIEDKKVKKYIVSINDDTQIDKYMNLSISDNGELVYKIGQLLSSNERDNLESYYIVDVEYEINNETIMERKVLDVLNNLFRSNEGFSFTMQDDIPIISLRSFILTGETKNKFLESAFECKKSNINILDLRGNIGGDGSLVVRWLENRFGFRPVGNSKKIGLNRFLVDGNIPNIKESDICNLYNLEVKKDYFYSKDIDNKELYNNDSLIFVLMDKNQGSAGEMFVEYLKNYRNVILVGTNSSGTLQSSSYGINFRLPNSEIEFDMGQWLYLYDEYFFQEGVGFKPDIWVNGDEALNEVMKLIEHYNLK